MADNGSSSVSTMFLRRVTTRCAASSLAPRRIGEKIGIAIFQLEIFRSATGTKGLRFQLYGKLHEFVRQSDCRGAYRLPGAMSSAAFIAWRWRSW